MFVLKPFPAKTSQVFKTCEVWSSDMIRTPALNSDAFGMETKRLRVNK
jgi:hypothetical protein